MWSKEGSLWVYTARPVAPEKRGAWEPDGGGRPLALFDFDSTLHPYRGKGPRAEMTLRLLKTLSADHGHRVVIFSNRSKASFGALAELRRYVERLEGMGGRCDVYAATARDRCRKPQLGAWEAFCRRRGVAPSEALLLKSFYCGDAAGRATDFSAADRRFAHNAGLPFHVPEQLLGRAACAKGEAAPFYPAPAPPLAAETAAGRPAPWACEGELAAAGSEERRAAASAALAAAGAADVVVLVGSPASGKSSFARRLAAEKGFRVAGNDAARAAGQSGAAFLAAALASGSRVVVDNTHATRAGRARTVAAARAARPTARVALVWVRAPPALCAHLDGLRCDSDETGGTPLLPRPVIPVYWKKFEAPAAAEADALVPLDFAWAPGTPPERARRRYG